MLQRHLFAPEPYLHPLLFHSHKANILLGLFKMCMTDIAEKSSELHQPKKRGYCRRERAPSWKAQFVTLQRLTILKHVLRKWKHKSRSHTHTRTHKFLSWMESSYWDNETMLTAAYGSLGEPVNVAFVRPQYEACSLSSQLSLFSDVFRPCESEDSFICCLARPQWIAETETTSVRSIKER